MHVVGCTRRSEVTPNLFYQAWYSVCIVGTTVLTVSATDIDVNDTLVYALVTGKADFNIDGSSGIITAKREFDREVGEIMIAYLY